MSRNIFTAEQDNAIRNMFAAGHTDTQIGAHLGMTKGRVVGRRHRLQGKKFKCDTNRVRIKPDRPEPNSNVVGVVKRLRGPESVIPKYDPRKHGKWSLSVVMDVALRVPEETLLDNIREPVEPVEIAAPAGPVIRGTPWKHPRGCQWHLGRKGLTHLFCCKPTASGSWCHEHAERVFAPRKKIAHAA